MRIVYVGKKPVFKNAVFAPGKTFIPNEPQEVTDAEARKLLDFPTFKTELATQQEKLSTRKANEATPVEDVPKPTRTRRKKVE